MNSRGPSRPSDGPSWAPAIEMDDWDPSVAPPREAWLAMDEQARIERVLAAHRRLGRDILHAAIGNEIAHGALHAILETQIALGEPAATASTLARLEADGLKRHAAMHGLLLVLAKQLGATTESGRFDHDAYEAALAALTPEFILDGLVRAVEGHEEEPPEPPRNRAERRAAQKRPRRGQRR